MAKTIDILYREHLATETVARDTKINDSPRYVTFTYPGIPFWCFDVHTNAPGLMNVVGVCEDCWVYGLNVRMPDPPNHTLVCHRELRHSGFLSFQTDIELKIKRSLYNNSVPKWPLKAKFSYGNTKGGFITKCLELRTSVSQDPMVTMTLCNGFVDKRTRKVANSLPQWFTSEMDGKQTLQKGLKIERQRQRPGKTYRQKMMIFFSEIDSNNHTNYKVYIRRCYDALLHAITVKEMLPANAGLAMENHTEGDTYDKQSTGNVSASQSGSHEQVLPRWLTSEIMRQGVSTLRVKFIKETLAGEEVSVHVWQEENKPFWAFFSLERETELGDQILFEMSLEFFGPSPYL